jgi:Tfp pilus assembly protein PilN
LGQTTFLNATGLATEDAEVEALEHDIELIRREQSALPARLLEVKAVLDAETAAAATRTAAAQHQEQHKQRKLDALREALDCYKDRLALAFEHSDDDGECLNVVLTQVDPRNGDRPFFFAIQVLDGDLYNVQTCEPSVPNLPALVSQLNSSNDFSQFVRKLRQEFKALVAAEMKG